MSHKAKRNKMKLPRREFPSPRAHMRSCSGSTSYFHIRGRNCCGVPQWCPIEIPSGQTPGSTLGTHAISRGSEQEKRKRLSRWRNHDRFVGVLVYGNDRAFYMCVRVCMCTYAEGNIFPNTTIYMRICSRISEHTRAQLPLKIKKKKKVSISFRCTTK